MGTTYYLKENDTLPKLQVSMVDSTGAPVDLTSVDTVTLLLKLANTVFSDSMVVVGAATNGQVEWQPATADWATLAKGKWKMEIELVYSSGDVLTVPTSGYLTLVIDDDLGDTP